MLFSIRFTVAFCALRCHIQCGTENPDKLLSIHCLDASSLFWVGNNGKNHESDFIVTGSFVSCIFLFITLNEEVR